MAKNKKPCDIRETVLMTLPFSPLKCQSKSLSQERKSQYSISNKDQIRENISHFLRHLLP